MYELPFPELKTEEDYWNSYKIQGDPKDIANYDFLTREIFVSSYGLAKIDMYNRKIKMYEKLIALMGDRDIYANGITKEDANKQIEEYKKLKYEEEDRMLTIGFDMSNVYFAVGNNAILDGNYERAATMYEKLIELEKLIYPAYFNLTASYEYIARSKDTPYEKEAEYLNKAKATLLRAEKTFYRGKGGGIGLEQNSTYNQIKQFENRIDTQLKTTRKQADEFRNIAIKEDTFDSYSSYANYIYQNRQDLDETIWAKIEAKKRAKNTSQMLAINKDLIVLYANSSDIDNAIRIVNETLAMNGLTADDRRGIEFDLANIYLNRKMYEDALAIYNKYTNNINQDGAFALYAIGHIYIEQNMIVEALNIYDKFVRDMSELAKTNNVVAQFKQDVENRRVQIIQYLSSIGANRN